MRRRRAPSSSGGALGRGSPGESDGIAADTLDGEGHNCGKIDDLEITGLDGDSPEVVEILVGGNAWRSRGRLGRLAALLSGDAVHVHWDEVDEVSSVVTLKRLAAELRLTRGNERWARLIRRLPGS